MGRSHRSGHKAPGGAAGTTAPLQGHGFGRKLPTLHARRAGQVGAAGCSGPGPQDVALAPPRTLTELKPEPLWGRPRIRCRGRRVNAAGRSQAEAGLQPHGGSRPGAPPRAAPSCAEKSPGAQGSGTLPPRWDPSPRRGRTHDQLHAVRVVELQLVLALEAGAERQTLRLGPALLQGLVVLGRVKLPGQRGQRGRPVAGGRGGRGRRHFFLRSSRTAQERK